MPLVFDPESKNNVKPVLIWFWNTLKILNAPQILRRRLKLQEHLTNYILSSDFSDLMEENSISQSLDLPNIRILNNCFENLNPRFFHGSRYFPGYYESNDNKIYLCLNFIDSEKVLRENFIRELLLYKSSNILYDIVY